MFTYNRYQDAHPTHCISNLYLKKNPKCIKQERAFQFCWYCSLSSTCCSTTDYTIFPHPAPPGQSPDAGEAEAVSTFWQGCTQTRCTQVWDLGACKAWHRGAACCGCTWRISHLTQKSREAKGEKTKPLQSLSINESPATVQHLCTKMNFFTSAVSWPSALLQSKQGSTKETPWNTRLISSYPAPFFTAIFPESSIVTVSLILWNNWDKR